MSRPPAHSATSSTIEKLLRYSDSKRLKARLIIPGDTAPLMMWTAADGWRDWVHPAERATQAPT